MKRVFLMLVLGILSLSKSYAQDEILLNMFLDALLSPSVPYVDDNKDARVENHHFVGVQLGMSTINNTVLTMEYGYGIYRNLRLLGKGSIMFPKLNVTSFLLNGELQCLVPVATRWNSYLLLGMGVLYSNEIKENRTANDQFYFEGGLGADYQMDEHWILTMSFRLAESKGTEIIPRVGVLYKF